ncbi:MAG: hypothetical protein K8R54_14635 [Bacteroidales bacterium]|nr:hypothetical protein [Bacteroidales bacterium]
MTTLTEIKNRLIDRILISKDEKFLKAIENIFVSVQKEDTVSMTSEQIEILNMSEQDIKDGNLIFETELIKADAQWMH